MSTEVLKAEPFEGPEDLCTSSAQSSPQPSLPLEPSVPVTKTTSLPAPATNTAESSRCTTPVSPPSDVLISGNVTSNEDIDEVLGDEVDDDDDENECKNDIEAEEEEDNDEEEDGDEEDDVLDVMGTLNLTLPKISNAAVSLVKNEVDNNGNKIQTMKNNNGENIDEEQDLLDSILLEKPSRSGSFSSGQNVAESYKRASSSSALTAALQDMIPPSSPEFIQLLLEYRQVLLDVLARSFKAAGSEVSSPQQQSQQEHPQEHGFTLPLQCKCGLNSKLSTQITRCSAYVHQLELRFCSLIDLSRRGEMKYTPKRPNFVNAVSPFGIGAMSQLLADNPTVAMAAVAASTFPQNGATSILANKGLSGNRISNEKKTSSSKQQLMQILAKQPSMQQSTNRSQQSSMLYSNASNTSSLNGDDEEGDSEDEAGSTLGSGRSNNNGIQNNFGMEFDDNPAMEMKSILKPYLESNNIKQQQIKSEDASDNELMYMDQQQQQQALNGLGQGKHIDNKTKDLIVQYHRNGMSVASIGRRLGFKGKEVRKVLANYSSFGLNVVQPNNVNGCVSKAKNLNDKNIHILKDSILRLYSQGNSYTQISRQMALSKQLVMKTIRQYVEENKIVTKGPSYMSQRNAQANIAAANAAAAAAQQRRFSTDDAFDGERGMMFQENAGDDEEDEYGEDGNGEFSLHGSANSLEAMAIAMQQQQQLKPSKSSLKSRNGMSLMQSAYNTQGNAMAQAQAALQQQQHNNNRIMAQQSQHNDRFKPYDLKGRGQMNDMFNNQRAMSKMSQIVPPLNKSMNHYTNMQRQKHEMKMMNKNGFLKGMANINNNNNSNNDLMDSLLRSKGNKLKESLLITEADKNNNTTLANCNVPISPAGGSSSNGGDSVNGEPLPPIPPSLLESTSDSESANLVPKKFSEGFPTGIMNSLNPNRATKLTLEDFNIVWQLRSQHWTHNQIRRFFQQRGKSISKSSISRIMNGKQRNFQQFFNVVPSGNF